MKRRCRRQVAPTPTSPPTKRLFVANYVLVGKSTFPRPANEAVNDRSLSKNVFSIFQAKFRLKIGRLSEKRLKWNRKFWFQVISTKKWKLMIAHHVKIDRYMKRSRIFFVFDGIWTHEILISISIWEQKLEIIISNNNKTIFLAITLCKGLQFFPNSIST